MSLEKSFLCSPYVHCCWYRCRPLATIARFHFLPTYNRSHFSVSSRIVSVCSISASPVGNSYTYIRTIVIAILHYICYRSNSIARELNNNLLNRNFLYLSKKEIILSKTWKKPFLFLQFCNFPRCRWDERKIKINFWYALAVSFFTYYKIDDVRL